MNQEVSKAAFRGMMREKKNTSGKAYFLRKNIFKKY
jgi:hypothetical protein